MSGLTVRNFEPLQQGESVFHQQATKLVNDNTGIKSGDKLSWVVDPEYGSISPEIFKNVFGQELLRSCYSRWSGLERIVDGQSASERAIEWSLGYVKSKSSNKAQDGNLCFQDKLVKVFETLAVTYTFEDKIEIAKNYIAAAEIIQKEWDRFPFVEETNSISIQQNTKNLIVLSDDSDIDDNEINSNTDTNNSVENNNVKNNPYLGYVDNLDKNK